MTTYDPVWESLDVFNPVKLRTGEDIKGAVNIIQNSLDDKAIGSIIQFSLRRTQDYALEFILSCMLFCFCPCQLPTDAAAAVCDAYATRISTFILNKFPSNIEGFYGSVGYRVITRLSHTLESLPFAAGAKPDGLDDHLQHGKLALAALSELRALLQSEVFDKQSIVMKKNRRSPRLTRQSGPSANMEGDIQCFEALGLRFPRTRLSAEETAQKMIATQRNVLKVHLPAIHVTFHSSAESYTSFSSERFGTVKS